MIAAPSLLMLAELPDQFDLEGFRFKPDVQEILQFHDGEVDGVPSKEIHLDGTNYLMRVFGFKETRDAIGSSQAKGIFCKSPENYNGSIGICLANSSMETKHIPKANRSLLLLGKFAADVIGATNFVWLPAGTIIGADYFEEALGDYIDQGLFPALVQTAYEKTGSGKFQSKGLAYFVDQEIELTTPDNFPEKSAIKIMVRIAHDIATNGKIDSIIETQGLTKNQHLSFKPSDNGKTVHALLQTRTI